MRLEFLVETINVTVENQSIDFSEARRQAVGKAGEKLTKPVIIAWKDDKTRRSCPEIPGGSSDRWHDYGESYGGEIVMFFTWHARNFRSAAVTAGPSDT